MPRAGPSERVVLMKTLFLLTVLAEEKKTPEAADVVAGWTGFAVFLGLIVATALLCWSFTRQIRKAKRSEEHTSELQSLMRISYAVFCLTNKKTTSTRENDTSNIHKQNKHSNIQ